MPSRLQESVTCGPVSLLMAADALLGQHGVLCDALVEAAVQRGFSTRGEMFDSHQMALLAHQVLGLSATVISGETLLLLLLFGTMFSQSQPHAFFSL